MSVGRSVCLSASSEIRVGCQKLLQNRRWATEIRAVSVFLFIMEFVSIFTGNASKYKWRHAQNRILEHFVGVFKVVLKRWFVMSFMFLELYQNKF